ncbi:MAG: hypothetical protein ACREJO_10510 [Phycisphaerales bacterium]
MRRTTMSVMLAAGSLLTIIGAATAQQVDTRVETRAAGQPPRNTTNIGPGNLVGRPGLGAPGGGGRALDANTSATGGRFNNQVRDMQALYDFNNAVADGNAGYGKSLRVPTATTNFDGFRGLLGSESQYRFRADSASGAQIAQGISSSDALRYQFAMETGRPVSYRLYDALSIAPRGNPGTGAQVSEGIVADLRSVSQFQSNASRFPTVLGYSKFNDTSSAVIASPLQGLAMVGLDRGTDGKEGLISGMEQAGRGVTRPADMLRYENDRKRDLPPSAVDTKVDTSVSSYGTVMDAYKTSWEKTNPGAAKPDGTKPDGSKPDGTKPDGTKPATSTPGTGLTDPSKPDPTKPNPSGTDPAKPDAPKNQPTWEERLDNLRKLMDKTNKQGGLVMPTRPAPEGNEANTRSIALNNPDPKPETKTNKPTDDRLRPTAESTAKVKADEARRDAAQRSIAEAQQMKETIAALAAMDARVDSFLLKGEPVESRFARLMNAAEADLAKGSYFDAEGLFVVAQAQKLRDVMAQVGMVHARIGAGVLVSAANSLDDLLRLQPEVIPVRYGPRLLPPKARADQLAADLIAELKQPQPTTGPRTGLLLAYLGFQYDQRTWLEQGLTALKAGTLPTDEAGQRLFEVVSTVWNAKVPK